MKFMATKPFPLNGCAATTVITTLRTMNSQGQHELNENNPGNSVPRACSSTTSVSGFKGSRAQGFGFTLYYGPT